MSGSISGRALKDFEKRRDVACRLFFCDIFNGDDKAQAHAVTVRVEEAAAEESFRHIPHEEVGRPFAVGDVEPIVDQVGVELDEFLDPDGIVMRPSGRPQARLFRDQRKHPVAGEDHVGTQFVAPCDDAGDFPVFTDHVRNEGLGKQHGPALLDPLGEPTVEFRAKDTVALGLFGSQFAAGIVEGEGAVAGHEGGPFADDGPLEGSLLPESREQIADGIYVEAAAGDVLGAGIIAALEDDDLDALTGQRPRRRQPRKSRPDNDDIEFLHRSHALVDVYPNRFLTYPVSLASASPNRQE